MVIIIMNKRISVKLTNGTTNLFDKLNNEYLMGVGGSHSMIIEFAVKKLKEVGFDKIDWLKMYNKKSIIEILGEDYDNEVLNTKITIKEETYNDLNNIKSILEEEIPTKIYLSTIIRVIMIALFKTGVMEKGNI